MKGFENFSFFHPQSHFVLDRLADKYNIRLIDFNKEKAIRVKNRDALILKEFYIPEIVQDAFIISVPVLNGA